MRGLSSSLEAVAIVIRDSLEPLEGMDSTVVMTAWMHVTAFLVSTTMNADAADEWIDLLEQYVHAARKGMETTDG